MARNNRGGNSAPAEEQEDRQVEDVMEQAEGEGAQAEAPATENFTLTYRREHPGNRCSYGIPGVAGIVVFDRGLFADANYRGPIQLDVPMALPKGDARANRDAAQAQKVIERAAKQQQRIEQQTLKAKERQEAANKKLEEAKRKLAEAEAMLKGGNKTAGGKPDGASA